MTGILPEITTYLAAKAGLVAGTSIFYNEMPDAVNKCVLVQELQHNMYVPVQLDVGVHRLRIVARDVTNVLAEQLARKCYRWLYTDEAAYDTDPLLDVTGFITLLDAAQTKIQVVLYGNPVWDKTDQQNRKYYEFYAVVNTKR